MVLHKDFPVSPTRCSRQDSKVSGPGLRTAGDLFPEGARLKKADLKKGSIKFDRLNQ